MISRSSRGGPWVAAWAVFLTLVGEGGSQFGRGGVCAVNVQPPGLSPTAMLQQQSPESLNTFSFLRSSRPAPVNAGAMEHPSTFVKPAHHYDFDVLIIGCGVGGHGAALQAVSYGLSVGIFTGQDIGGTCVNRGCIPSKALLAAAGKIHAMRDSAKLAKLGIAIKGTVDYDREGVSNHAAKLVATLRKALEDALNRHKVSVIPERAALEGAHTVTAGGRTYTARDIIVSTGSSPLVPPGIPVDEERIFTSDRAVTLHTVPQWIAIIGSGYIGLEFADIYASLGAEVTMIEASDRILPTFDKEIAKQADKTILQSRGIEVITNALATSIQPPPSGSSGPVVVELTDVATGNLREKLAVDAVMVATGRKPNSGNLNLESVGAKLTSRNFIPADEYMRVLARDGTSIVPHIYAIGDVNGKMMLAHAASAQGAAVIDHIVARRHDRVDHNQIPAACFTHPEIGSVGLAEEAAADLSLKQGFSLGVVSASYRANSKALADLDTDGSVRLFFRKDNGKILGCHMLGTHASDLIQQVANAMRAGQTVQDLAFAVHSHPTLSEVMLDVFKQAAGFLSH